MVGADVESGITIFNGGQSVFQRNHGFTYCAFFHFPISG